MEKGDIIIEVNGQKIKEISELSHVGSLPPDTEVKLKVLRKGVERQISLKLAEF